MNKLILVSVFVIGSVFSMNAQADSGIAQVGLKGGANFATVMGDDFDSPDSRVGFYAGLMAEIPFSERFSVQPELLYSQQGFKINESEWGDAKYRINYIQIPILAKVYLVKGLNIQVGPQLGFNVHEDIHFDTDMGDGSIDTSDSDVKDLDFGVAAGLGYKFDNGFYLQARYNYGITKIIEDADVHNSVFQAGIGFMF